MRLRGCNSCCKGFGGADGARLEAPRGHWRRIAGLGGMFDDSGQRALEARRRIESDRGAAELRRAGSILDYALVDFNRVVLPLIDDPGPGSLLRDIRRGARSAARDQGRRRRHGSGDLVRSAVGRAVHSRRRGQPAQATLSRCPIRLSTPRATSPFPTRARSGR